jgi:hypothetical protein
MKSCMLLDKPKIFQESQTWEKCTKILRKGKRSKIQVVIYLLYAIFDQFCIFLICYLCLHILTYFLLIYFDCKACLQCGNYCLSLFFSQYFTFKYIFKIFMKIHMNLEVCSFKKFNGYWHLLSVIEGMVTYVYVAYIFPSKQLRPLTSNHLSWVVVYWDPFIDAVQLTNKWVRALPLHNARRDCWDRPSSVKLECSHNYDF